MATIKMRVDTVAIDDLLDSPLNPRKHYDEAKIDQLAEVIREVGWVGTLLGRDVAGSIELVYGHCRKRAAKKAGMTVLPVEVRELTDEQVLAIALAENVAREDMSPIEEGDGFRAWVDMAEDPDDEAEREERTVELAARMGRPLSFVRGRLALADLPPRARGLLKGGLIGVGHGLILARLEREMQEDACAFLQSQHDREGEVVTVRTLTRWIADQSTDLARAGWNLDDADLVLGAGACSACPKRTGATADLFPGVADDRCLDAECYQRKAEAHRKDQAAAAPKPPAPDRKPLPAAGASPDWSTSASDRPASSDEYSLRLEARTRVFREVMDRIALTNEGDLQRPELELVAAHLHDLMCGEDEQIVMASLRGEGEAPVADTIEDMGSDDLARLIIASALIEDASPYAANGGARLLATARRLGVDVEAIQRAVLEEAAKTTKAKKR